MSMNRVWYPVLGLVALISTGCAVGRSVVSIPVNKVENPAQGVTVVIADVTDNRQFVATPAEPSTPSLKDGAITDKAITSRAFARKRNTYGMYMGDILLPEGESVSTLVKQGLTNALRSKGYRVQEAGPNAPADALTLKVDIKRYWCWMEPGMWYLTSNFQGELEMKGPIFKSGDKETVEAKTDKGHQIITDNDWMLTAQGGLEALMVKVTEKLK